MWRHLASRTGRFLTLTTVTLAAIVAVVSNVETLHTKIANWADTILRPHAAMEIRLESGIDRQTDVAIASPSEKDRVIDIRRTTSGESAIFRLPVDARYTVFWQGAGIKAARIDDVVVSRAGSRFRLVSTGSEQDLEVLALRNVAIDSGEAASDPATPQPAPASLLVSAIAASAARNPAIHPLANGVLPELDRALMVVGLFETGTTDCARRLLVAETFVSVGCLGISLPGPLPKLIADVDGDEARRLDGLLGAADAQEFRESLQANSSTEPLLVKGTIKSIVTGLRQLTAMREFWIAYQQFALDLYEQALEAARSFGLTSDRGVLFMLDKIVHQGPLVISRIRPAYARDVAAHDAPNEEERLQVLGELAKRSIGKLPERPRSFIEVRIDTIVSGKGTVRGVAFDLGELVDCL